MSDKILLDTNIWVYTYAQNSPYKSIKARELVDNNFTSIVISTQILGEFYNVLVKKKLISKDKARSVILEMIANFPIAEIDVLKVTMALEVSTKYNYSYWDSLIIATVLQNNCSVLYSEDMQSNQLIEERTRIINPF